jgi:peptidyl-prolyl cis-trans isomerase B (cyclophilin B)
MNMESNQAAVRITTSRGNIDIELYGEQTPVTVANFVNLAQRGFYSALNFHRVIADFMVQAGCPQGTGTGGPGYRFGDEIVADLKHDRPGILSMANAGPGTNGSQFFITHIATPWLDGKHTVFGAVMSQSDQDVINTIQSGDEIESITPNAAALAILESNSAQIAEWNAILGD